MAKNGSHTRKPHADIAFVSDPQAARSLLDPLRRAILDGLQEPGSSTSVAQALDLPRQRVNYHVRELEESGLLRHVEDRRRGNCVERILQASARRYVVDPRAVGTQPPAGTAEERVPEPFASATLLGSAARTLATVGELHEEAYAEGRRLPTMCLETRIRFRSPRHEQEFAQVIGRVLRRLTARYDDRSAESGRAFRITLGGHPDPRPPRNASPNPRYPRPSRKPAQNGGES